MDIDPISLLLFMFEVAAIAYAKKSEDESMQKTFLKSAIIVVAVNAIIVNVYFPELPASSKILSFFAPTSVKLFLGAYDFFKIISVFLSEVSIRGLFMILMFRGDLGDFTNSFIISLAKNVLITMAGSFL